MYIHKFSLNEIEGMIPWERDLYVERLGQHLEKIELQTRQNEIERTGRRR